MSVEPQYISVFISKWSSITKKRLGDKNKPDLLSANVEFTEILGKDPSFLSKNKKLNALATALLEQSLTNFRMYAANVDFFKSITKNILTYKSILNKIPASSEYPYFVTALLQTKDEEMIFSFLAEILPCSDFSITLFTSNSSINFFVRFVSDPALEVYFERFCKLFSETANFCSPGNQTPKFAHPLLQGVLGIVENATMPLRVRLNSAYFLALYVFKISRADQKIMNTLKQYNGMDILFNFFNSLAFSPLPSLQPKESNLDVSSEKDVNSQNQPTEPISVDSQTEETPIQQQIKPEENTDFSKELQDYAMKTMRRSFRALLLTKEQISGYPNSITLSFLFTAVFQKSIQYSVQLSIIESFFDVIQTDISGNAPPSVGSPTPKTHSIISSISESYHSLDKFSKYFPLESLFDIPNRNIEEHNRVLMDILSCIIEKRYKNISLILISYLNAPFEAINFETLSVVLGKMISQKVISFDSRSCFMYFKFFQSFPANISLGKFLSQYSSFALLLLKIFGSSNECQMPILEMILHSPDEVIIDKNNESEDCSNFLTEMLVQSPTVAALEAFFSVLKSEFKERTFRAVIRACSKNLLLSNLFIEKDYIFLILTFENDTTKLSDDTLIDLLYWLSQSRFSESLNSKLLTLPENHRYFHLKSYEKLILSSERIEPIRLPVFLPLVEFPPKTSSQFDLMNISKFASPIYKRLQKTNPYFLQLSNRFLSMKDVKTILKISEGLSTDDLSLLKQTEQQQQEETKEENVFINPQTENLENKTDDTKQNKRKSSKNEIKVKAVTPVSKKVSRSQNEDIQPITPQPKNPRRSQNDDIMLSTPTPRKGKKAALQQDTEPSAIKTKHASIQGFTPTPRKPKYASIRDDNEEQIIKNKHSSIQHDEDFQDFQLHLEQIQNISDFDKRIQVISKIVEDLKVNDCFPVIEFFPRLFRSVCVINAPDDRDIFTGIAFWFKFTNPFHQNLFILQIERLHVSLTETTIHIQIPSLIDSDSDTVQEFTANLEPNKWHFIFIGNNQFSMSIGSSKPIIINENVFTYTGQLDFSCAVFGGGSNSSSDFSWFLSPNIRLFTKTPSETTINELKSKGPDFFLPFKKDSSNSSTNSILISHEFTIGEGAFLVPYFGFASYFTHPCVLNLFFELFDQNLNAHQLLQLIMTSLELYSIISSKEGIIKSQEFPQYITILFTKIKQHIELFTVEHLELIFKYLNPLISNETTSQSENGETITITTIQVQDEKSKVFKQFMFDIDFWMKLNSKQIGNIISMYLNEIIFKIKPSIDPHCNDMKFINEIFYFFCTIFSSLVKQNDFIKIHSLLKGLTEITFHFRSITNLKNLINSILFSKLYSTHIKITFLQYIEEAIDANFAPFVLSAFPPNFLDFIFENTDESSKIENITIQKIQEEDTLNFEIWKILQEINYYHQIDFPPNFNSVRFAHSPIFWYIFFGILTGSRIGILAMNKDGLFNTYQSLPIKNKSILIPILHLVLETTALFFDEQSQFLQKLLTDSFNLLGKFFTNSPSLLTPEVFELLRSLSPLIPRLSPFLDSITHLHEEIPNDDKPSKSSIKSMFKGIRDYIFSSYSELQFKQFSLFSGKNPCAPELSYENIIQNLKQSQGLYPDTIPFIKDLMVAKRQIEISSPLVKSKPEEHMITKSQENLTKLAGNLSLIGFTTFSVSVIQAALENGEEFTKLAQALLLFDPIGSEEFTQIYLKMPLLALFCTSQETIERFSGVGLNSLMVLINEELHLILKDLSVPMLTFIQKILTSNKPEYRAKIKSSYPTIRDILFRIIMNFDIKNIRLMQDFSDIFLDQELFQSSNSISLLTSLILPFLPQADDIFLQFFVKFYQTVLLNPKYSNILSTTDSQSKPLNDYLKLCTENIKGFKKNIKSNEIQFQSFSESLSQSLAKPEQPSKHKGVNNVYEFVSLLARQGATGVEHSALREYYLSSVDNITKWVLQLLSMIYLREAESLESISIITTDTHKPFPIDKTKIIPPPSPIQPKSETFSQDFTTEQEEKEDPEKQHKEDDEYDSSIDSSIDNYTMLNSLVWPLHPPRITLQRNNYSDKYHLILKKSGSGIWESEENARVAYLAFTEVYREYGKLYSIFNAIFSRCKEDVVSTVFVYQEAFIIATFSSYGFKGGDSLYIHNQIQEKIKDKVIYPSLSHEFQKVSFFAGRPVLIFPYRDILQFHPFPTFAFFSPFQSSPFGLTVNESFPQIFIDKLRTVQNLNQSEIVSQNKFLQHNISPGHNAFELLLSINAADQRFFFVFNKPVQFPAIDCRFAHNFSPKFPGSSPFAYYSPDCISYENTGKENNIIDNLQSLPKSILGFTKATFPKINVPFIQGFGAPNDQQNPQTLESTINMVCGLSPYVKSDADSDISGNLVKIHPLSITLADSILYDFRFLAGTRISDVRDGFCVIDFDYFSAVYQLRRTEVSAKESFDENSSRIKKIGEMVYGIDDPEDKMETSEKHISKIDVQDFVCFTFVMNSNRALIWDFMRSKKIREITLPDQFRCIDAGFDLEYGMIVVLGRSQIHLLTVNGFLVSEFRNLSNAEFDKILKISPEDIVISLKDKQTFTLKRSSNELRFDNF